MVLFEESIFKILFLSCLIPFFLIRSYFSSKYLSDDPTFTLFPIHIKIMFIITILFLIIAPLIYIFTPFLDSFNNLVPDEFRIFGFILFIIVDLFMWWILASLNINFDESAENRYIVTSGPYRIVRHPMYLIFILQAVAQGLLSGNAILFSGIFFVLFLKIFRVKYEDQKLINEFGDQYLEFKKRKKGLIPFIW